MYDILLYFPSGLSVSSLIVYSITLALPLLLLPSLSLFVNMDVPDRIKNIPKPKLVTLISIIFYYVFMAIPVYIVYDVWDIPLSIFICLLLVISPKNSIFFWLNMYASMVLVLIIH